MNHVDSKQWTWQQALETRTEFLVDLADDTMSEAKMKKFGRELKNAQLSNFLSVSLSTPSVSAVVNWIRYQEGRKETKPAWGDSGLGQDITNKIEKMRPEAIAVAKQVYGDKPSNQEILDIHMSMIRQYAGYVRRWFIARGGK